MTCHIIFEEINICWIDIKLKLMCYNVLNNTSESQLYMNIIASFLLEELSQNAGCFRPILLKNPFPSLTLIFDNHAPSHNYHEGPAWN